MKNLIITIVSKQTVPNVLFINQFGKPTDTYLFITTRSMKKCMEYIINATKISNYHSIDLINENSNIDILNDLENFEFDYTSYDNILLNITGGTKLISLIVDKYFDQLPNIKKYYNHNAQEYLELSTGKTGKFSEKGITLEQYLACYGIEYKPSAYIHTQEIAHNMFKAYTEGVITEHHNALTLLYKYRGKKSDKISLDKLTPDEDQQVKEFLEILGLPIENNTIEKSVIKYITGEWFEEYMGYSIQDKYGLSSNEVWTGTKLEISTINNQQNRIEKYITPNTLEQIKKEAEKQETDNEIDVMYIYKNELYTIECKSNIIDFNGNNILGDTIYKADSIQKNFGLFPKTKIALGISIDEFINEHHKKDYVINLKNNAKTIISSLNRAKLANIEIIDQTAILNDKK